MAKNGDDPVTIRSLKTTAVITGAIVTACSAAIVTLILPAARAEAKDVAKTEVKEQLAPRDKLQDERHQEILRRLATIEGKIDRR